MINSDRLGKTILRIFPRKTVLTPRDPYAFVGDPPLSCLLPDWRDIKEVHISVTFTWDIEEGERLAMAWSQYHPEVYIGGPAFNNRADGFTPGLYVRQGITFTSRGCNNQCPWCLVPQREGKLRPINNFAQGNIIQDNNLLQCPSDHLKKVFGMLRGEHNIQFTGGLDVHHLTDSIADSLRSLRVGQLFFACDSKEALRPLREVSAKLKGLSRNKLRCYVLLAFNGETISNATERLEQVWDAGFIPFAQLYQPPDHYICYPKEWRTLARMWSRPAITKTIMKERCYA